MVPTFAVTNSSFRLLLFLSILLWLSFHTFLFFYRSQSTIFIENFLFYCYISSSIILKLDPFIALSFSSSNFHQIVCATKVNQTTTNHFLLHNNQNSIKNLLHLQTRHRIASIAIQSIYHMVYHKLQNSRKVGRQQKDWSSRVMYTALCTSCIGYWFCCTSES